VTAAHQTAQATQAKPAPAGGIVQRACACGQHTAAGGECAACRNKREATLQRAAISSPPVGQAPPLVHDVLRTPGQPLDAATRGFMEPRFGHDFSRVRVHSDARAAESAQVVNALAYTVGRDVVFGAGQYAPGTPAGRDLLAHELTHVIQQKFAPPFIPSQLKVLDDIGSEQEAFQAATTIANTQSASKQPIYHQRHSSRQLLRQRRPSQSRTVNTTVRVRWSDDNAEFYRRLLAALAHTDGFRQASESALVQPFHDPVIRFHHRYRNLHVDVRDNQFITVHASAIYDPSQRFSSVTQAQVLSEEDVQATEAEERYQAEQAERVQEAVSREPTAGNLEGFLRLSPKVRGVLDVIVSPDGVQIQSWQAIGEEISHRSRGRSASTRAASGSYVQFLSGVRGQYPRIYQAEFALRDNAWQMIRYELLAEVIPTPPGSQRSEVEPGEELDEGELIIEDIRGTRQLVLSTAAMLIAEQDPRRIENIVWAAGPFAITKLARVARMRGLTRVRNLLRTTRIPPAVPLRRMGTALDPELVRLARDVRVTQAGVTRSAFQQYNVATARVRIDGEIRYLDSGNLRSGPHSEEWLHSQVTELRRGHRDVVVEQLYSERIPCRGTCGPLLDRGYPNAEIFFTTRADTAPARARELMEAYGLAGQ